MVQDTDPALKQLTSVAITALAASSHLREETHDLVWKGWTYFLQEIHLPFGVKHCASKQQHCQDTLKKEWEQI